MHRAPRPAFAAAGLIPGLLLGLLAAAAPLAAPLAAQDEGLAIGATPAPATLATLDGDSVSLADLAGERPVLVEFWATWCPICRALEPRLRAAHARFGDRVAFVIVAVGVAQTPEQVRAHLARHPLPGRVLWDGEGRAVRAFEAPGTGYVVLLDGNGKVAYTGAGADQDLEAALTDVLSTPGNPGDPGDPGSPRHPGDPGHPGPGR